MKNKWIKLITIMLGLALSLNAFATGQKWRMALGDAAGSTQEVLAAKFAEIVSKKTNGKININIFPNGQLGSEQATVNDVALGTLDMSVLGSNNLAPFSPSMGILALPYIFENVQQAQTILNGKIGKGLGKDAIKNANVRILGWSYSGYRRLSNSKRPVTKMADLKGLIIRVPKTEVIIDTYHSWGTNPTPMAWSETFTGLQQKVVDGQDSPYAAFQSMKFGEIQKYITEFHYMYQLEPMIISESLYQKQTPEVQEILMQAGKEATRHELDWITKKEADIKRNLVAEYGIKIDQLTDEDKWIKKAREQVWPKFFKQVGGKKKVNDILLALGKEEI